MPVTTKNSPVIYIGYNLDFNPIISKKVIVYDKNSIKEMKMI